MEQLDRSVGFPHDVSALQDTPVSPNNPPWNSWVATGIWFLSVLAIVVFPLLFLIPYIVTQKGAFGDRESLGGFLQSDPTAILLQVLSVFPAHAVTLLAAWFVVTRSGRFSFRTVLGWTSGGVAWWHYALFMLCFFILAGVVNYYVPEKENDLIRILRSSRTAVVLVAIMATFTAPIVEEVVYRGLLYSAFQRTFGPALAIVAATVMFAAVHVPQYYPSVSTIFLLTLLSLTLTVIRAWSGNLLPCIVLHTIFNAAQSALLLLDPYIQTNTPEKVPALFGFLR